MKIDPNTQENQDTNVVAQKALKQNKLFFYGFPIVVIVVSLFGLLFIILPTIQYYFTSRTQHSSLNENITTVNQSISNLKKALNETNDIVTYDQVLSELLPSKPRVGELIDTIQKTANDFNLENKGGSSNNAKQTSLGNLATGDQALLESLDSGEIRFKPKSSNQDVDAVLISLEFNLKGDKEKFFQFLKDIKKIKPLVNVVYVDYSETQASTTTNQNIQVNAIVKFESYAVDLNTNNVEVKPTTQYKKDDSRLFSKMSVERFNWDRERIEEIVSKIKEGN
jgi:Tfp pilus assembly protein PilO